jgi:ubiquitin carboxyl-terminal hydrolase 5/13
MSDCTINLDQVEVPTTASKVFKDDCMFSFDTAFDNQGLDICMSCHQAFSRGEFKYTQMHSEFYGHTVFLNYKKVRKVQKTEEQPLKMMKLEVKESSDDDLFDTKCAIYLQDSDTTITYPNNELPLKVIQAAEGIINATSSEKKQEIMAWEQEIKTCKHSTSIDQHPIPGLQLQHCNSCDLSENLWICLHCGSLGCGRSQFGGVPGNSHAMAHQKEHPGHSIAVKLGSLSSDIADCYCYACDDEVKVPNLAALLKTFGIDITNFVKTEKSLTELQIEQNIQWDFKMTGDGDEEIRPIFGSGLTGLKNLGNSCYLASALQVLFSIDPFSKAYFNPDGIPLDKILGNFKPYEDLETQLFKLGDGLNSGRYSIPDEWTTETIKYQRGIKPSGFKSLIGEGHPEFSTMLQQDSFEFWCYLIEKIEKSNITGQLETSPTSSLKFLTQNKIKCTNCNGVRFKQDLTDNITVPISMNVKDVDSEGKKCYSPTTMEESLQSWNSSETFQYDCPKCDSSQIAIKCEGFETFPEYLVLCPQRIVLENWVPTKASVPISFSETLSLTPFKTEPLLESENNLPEDDASSDDNGEEFSFDQQALNSLMEMGFPENRAKHALYATANQNAEVAMNWLFERMDDPALEVPFQTPSKSTNPADNVDKEQLANLTSMGFSEKLSVKALVVNAGNVEAAVEWLFSNSEDDGEIAVSENHTESAEEVMEKLRKENENVKGDYTLLAVICHKGTSVHSGHYVAFVKKVVEGTEKWVLFNDEKVVLAGVANLKEIETCGYVYVYKRMA